MCLHADGGLVISGRDVMHVRDAEQRVLLGEMDGVAGFNDLGTGLARAVCTSAHCDSSRLRVRLQFPVRYGGSTLRGATAVLEGIDWPNGIGFSPDGATMYACDYAQEAVMTGDGERVRSLAGRLGRRAGR